MSDHPAAGEPPAEHQYFKADLTSVALNFARDIPGPRAVINYAQPNEPGEHGGTRIHLRFPMMIITDFVKESLDVAKRVAEILNAHWDTHGQPDPRDAEIERLKADVAQAQKTYEIWNPQIEKWIDELSEMRLAKLEVVLILKELLQQFKSRRTMLLEGRISQSQIRTLDAAQRYLDTSGGTATAPTDNQQQPADAISGWCELAVNGKPNPETPRHPRLDPGQGCLSETANQLLEILKRAEVVEIKTGAGRSKLTIAFADGLSAYAAAQGIGVTAEYTHSFK